jgi:hypothetical protein
VDFGQGREEVEHHQSCPRLPLHRACLPDLSDGRSWPPGADLCAPDQIVTDTASARAVIEPRHVTARHQC